MSAQDANDACCSNSCSCLSPFSISLFDSHKSTSSVLAAPSCCAFTNATISSLYPVNRFTNHESLPLLPEMYSKFIRAYPQYTDTHQADLIRSTQYNHLAVNNHVCLDYIGLGLFSYSQTQIAPLHLDISHKRANFYSLILNGGQEPENHDEFESEIRRRIMRFLNINEDEYSMVFTANQASAFRLLADAYPFQYSNRTLVTVYDHESEAVDTLIETSKKRGAHVMSTEFSWPRLRIQSVLLRKMIVRTKKRSGAGGLFVFPLQSKITGARYSYLWMSLARENGWHVLLDASALGPKDMETLGLSLFKPDFLICPFYKVFGENPSGFCCLFVKKSTASVFKDSAATTANIGMVKLIPSTKPLSFTEEYISSVQCVRQHEPQDPEFKSQIECSRIDFLTSKQQNEPIKPAEIVELNDSTDSSSISKSTRFINVSSEIICSGLDHADSLGLILIGYRTRFLINWLVNALTTLQHPSSRHSDESRLALVRIYGPKVKFHRGAALAFNIFDWKGEKIHPSHVQKLADRNNISLSTGVLQGIGFTGKYDEENEMILEGSSRHERKGKYCSGILVVTVAIGFLNNFEDVYKLWAFVSKFVDADYVEKERWRLTALS